MCSDEDCTKVLETSGCYFELLTKMFWAGIRDTLSKLHLFVPMLDIHKCHMLNFRYIVEKELLLAFAGN